MTWQKWVYCSCIFTTILHTLIHKLIMLLDAIYIVEFNGRILIGINLVDWHEFSNREFCSLCMDFGYNLARNTQVPLLEVVWLIMKSFVPDYAMVSFILATNFLLKFLIKKVTCY